MLAVCATVMLCREGTMFFHEVVNAELDQAVHQGNSTGIQYLCWRVDTLAQFLEL